MMYLLHLRPPRHLTFVARPDHLKQAIIEKVFPDLESAESALEKAFNETWVKKFGKFSNHVSWFLILASRTLLGVGQRS